MTPDELKTSAATHLRDGRVALAIGALEKYCELVPADAAMFSTLGNCLRETGELGKALPVLAHANRLDPTAPTILVNLAIALHQAGHRDRAIEALERALTISPDCLPALLNLGLIRFGAKQMEAAAGLLGRAIRLQPENLQARVFLANALMMLDRRSEAAEHVIAASGNMAPALPHWTIGSLLAKIGRTDLARQHFARDLELNPHDPNGSGHLLAQIDARPLPRPSDAFLKSLYRSRSRDFDRPNRYRGAQLVADAVKEFVGQDIGRSVLDLGCGTGAVGVLLGDTVGARDGVDISPDMIEVAKAKAVYRSLHCDDVVTFLNRPLDPYDVVTSAGALIHFGDLRPVLEGVHHALKSGGIFVFTVFPSTAEGFSLAPHTGLAEGGIYVHSEDYIRQVASEFPSATIRTDVHEYDKEAPRECLLVILQT